MTERARVVRTMAAGLLVAAAVSACTPRVATRGNLVEDYRLEQVHTGTSTKADVSTILGTPTTVSTFDDNIWYYIGQRVETVAFFAPEVTQRRVLRMQFDPTSSTLTDVKEVNLADAQQVAMVSRETPTLGRRIGILEQFLGNIGRFNDAAGSTAPNRRAGTGGVAGPGAGGGY
ncbi:outer membrane protein assembly factor BamE (lipoprotein component of BamABCDE complex) [Inquilinus ginsengisoli]|uniref:Outer membrane protein assembly factor BamE (Lipoprotein component of BamABCDE complex) n=1 Tax=Inquilinus ginsengisoli TaxID=363840 RepID=A0ABU1JRJ9_9PROT|nr:outer membrane protein assembly factor BamE [Inquilinus ginsengisoli]MDR6291236.1 outer membrane protein assembly factor BamE (lipoprotein component of BamABCDE complex) [Inquilinus ginsengisoli]